MSDEYTEPNLNGNSYKKSDMKLMQDELAVFTHRLYAGCDPGIDEGDKQATAMIALKWTANEAANKHLWTILAERAALYDMLDKLVVQARIDAEAQGLDLSGAVRNAQELLDKIKQ